MMPAFVPSFVSQGRPTYTSISPASNTSRNACIRRATGSHVLRDPHMNKDAAFTHADRDTLQLTGLLPPRVYTLQEQADLAYEQLQNCPTPLDRYVFLRELQDRNEHLFYQVVLSNTESVLPYIYTPTVGEACQKFGQIYRRARGLYITANCRGRIQEILDNWPHDEVRVICVTDGERILGLGDLGVSGMGIPIGKLALYTACGGVFPHHTLPITIDVGTDNEQLRNHPHYQGLRQPRDRSSLYDELIEEFMEAVRQRSGWEHVFVQFEDFGNRNAFRLLERYRREHCCFNDDIQGTAAVAVAGLYSALRVKQERLSEQKYLFLGAGEAGCGIGELLVKAMMEDEGLTEEEARKKCWFMDSKGLVVNSRDPQTLAHHKRPFAHDHPPCDNLLEAVNDLKPTCLIGVSAIPKAFNEDVVRAMAKHNKQPIIFALSNPTSKAECTSEEAYTWTDGRCLYASGSPMPRVLVDGKEIAPGQANNMFIFPAIGLAATLVRAKAIPDGVVTVAAKALAEEVTDRDLASGTLFPPVSNIREVALGVATRVAEYAFDNGLAGIRRPEGDLREWVRAQMYSPS
eukprot:Rmarinus@m.21212